MTDLVLLAAVARNGVIGRAQGMPWHLPEDLRRFRERTMDAPVLMGRATWDSLPPRFRPLPGRRNLVLSHQDGWHADGAERVATIDEALALVAGAAQLFVIGGAQVYALTLPRAQELWLTEIDRDFEGDAFFPAWPQEDFEEVERESRHAAPPNDFDFAFVTYRRRPPRP
ncbi:MAG TPA: dihydrofolate reductase [Rubrivivax sp.]|nr:dihydrofolate reductase [Burkholderiales bacterium]HNU10381.1 dihydrofolate reductase [Rubrivivax sp.]